MRKLLLLAAVGFGLTSMYAQTAPADSVYSTPSGGYTFTGSNFIKPLNYVDTRFDAGTTDFSVAATFTPTTSTGTQFIASKGNVGSYGANAPGWSLWFEGQNLRFRVCTSGTQSGTTYRASAYYVLPASLLNTSVKVVATIDHTTNKVYLYVNGLDVTTGGGGGPVGNSFDAGMNISSNFAPLTLGKTWANGNAFTGTISELKTYHRLLTSTEISGGVNPVDYAYSIPKEYTFSSGSYETIGKFMPNTGNYTILFALTPGATSATTQTIASVGNATATAAGWSLMESNGNIGFRLCNNTTAAIKASAGYGFSDASYLGKLVYGAAVIDSINAKVDFYLNGDNSAVTSTPGFGADGSTFTTLSDFTAINSPFTLGQDGAAANKFTGVLNNLIIYKRVLTATELQAWKQTVTATAQPASKAFQVLVSNGRVSVPGIKTFEIYSVTGQKQNIRQPLSNGLYILKIDESTQKFIVY